MLLLAPLPSVADLDGADADDDGHDEEEDATDETSRDCPPLDILRHGVPEEIDDDNDDDNDDDDLISGFPTTVLRKRPDFVLTGAPAPGRPKDKEASWQ